MCIDYVCCIRIRPGRYHDALYAAETYFRSHIFIFCVAFLFHTPGRHYDALYVADGRALVYPDPAAVEAVETVGHGAGVPLRGVVDGWAVALATELRRLRDLELRTRVRKRVRCSCGTVVDDDAAWQVAFEPFVSYVTELLESSDSKSIGNHLFSYRDYVCV